MSDKGIIVIFAVIAYLLWRHAQMTSATTKPAAGTTTIARFNHIRTFNAAS